jgi:GNAT superfamily N-acetyltransferase
VAAGQAILASSLRVASVRTDAEREDFISLPWRIYRDDPSWVPPLRREVARFLDPDQHPFYQHGAAHPFLAYRAGQAVGRVLVSDDPHFNERHGTNAGMFGMFEAVDDPRVATALLEAAAGWLAARGRGRMLGPIEYSTNYSCGLLVDGFDTPPRLLMNHNPPYYEGLLTGYGLRPVKELYAWWIDQVPDLRGWQRRAARVEARGVRIRNIRKRDLAAEVERAKLVYNEAWFNNWGFVRMTDAEFTDLGHHLAEIADERLMFVAEQGSEPVAFSLALPDVNEAFRAVPDGRLAHWGLPTGLLRLLVEMRRIRTFRFFTLGVRPAYQGRGIAEALILRTLDAALAAGYTGCEMGWTLDDNERVNRAIQRVGARRYKTYRIYEGAV